MSAPGRAYRLAAATRALDAARQRGRRQWAAVRLAAAPAEPPFALGEDADRFFWDRPAMQQRVVASGCAQALDFEGADRFSRAARSARALYLDLHLEGDEAPARAGPLIVGGFGFAHERSPDPSWRGFPAARLLLPARLFVSSPEGSWWTVVCPVEAGDGVETLSARLGEEVERCLSQPTSMPTAYAGNSGEFRLRAPRSQLDYEQRVARALEGIAAGEMEKVVVARSLHVQQSQGWQIAPLLEALCGAHPSCTTFAMGRGDADFLGASPELLIRVAGERLETAALAGSAPRGRSPEEDARLGRELLESKKDQAEHAVVVRVLRESLACCGDDLEIPEAPRLRELAGIQHLETPIRGRLRGDLHVLEVAGCLHPSPAVAGAPRSTALAWLREREALERGWYAGAVGIVDGRGDGEFCTALRSALLRGGEARLFAGAGIVAGSEARSELRETQLKLRTLLDPLLDL